MSHNIFKIPSPDDWVCRVAHFAPGHGLVTIRLINKNRDDGPAQLNFQHVIYFSGWFSWKGADFRMASGSELVDLVRRTSLGYETISDEEMLSVSKFGTSKLFICNAVDGDPIYIIANGGWSQDKDGATLNHSMQR